MKKEEKPKEEITLEILMKRIVKLEKKVAELSSELKTKEPKTIVYGR